MEVKFVIFYLFVVDFKVFFSVWYLCFDDLKIRLIFDEVYFILFVELIFREKI